MPAEPSYPKDGNVGDKTKAGETGSHGDKPKLNETLSHAVTAKEAEARAAEDAEKSKGSTRSFVRGAAIGVGSAALVAALLYARRSGRDKDKV